jgi:hypothetical protein
VQPWQPQIFPQAVQQHSPTMVIMQPMQQQMQQHQFVQAEVLHQSPSPLVQHMNWALQQQQLQYGQSRMLGVLPQPEFPPLPPPPGPPPGPPPPFMQQQELGRQAVVC